MRLEQAGFPSCGALLAIDISFSKRHIFSHSQNPLLLLVLGDGDHVSRGAHATERLDLQRRSHADDPKDGFLVH